MTIHYHGTPITPLTALYEMSGRHFCVSHFRPDDIRRADAIGQTVLLDNGAFSAWRSGNPIADWRPYYAFCEQWLERPTTWAIIPDEIEGDERTQDLLIKVWPFGFRGAPVWHMHESIERLLRLVDEWPRVCMGSSGEFAKVLSASWRRRADEAWDQIMKRRRYTPWVHMLRGMATLNAGVWPFASVDSTDIAQNHKLARNSVNKMVRRWDGLQAPAVFLPPVLHGEFDFCQSHTRERSDG